jgi:hypothetical protein
MKGDARVDCTSRVHSVFLAGFVSPGLGAGASFRMRFAQEGGFLVPGYLCLPWSGCGCVLLYAFRTGRGFPCPWLASSPWCGCVIL